MKKICSPTIKYIYMEHNLYVLFILIFISILLSYLFIYKFYHNSHNHNHNHNQCNNILKQNTNIHKFNLPTRIPLINDVLLDPYHPPLRNDTLSLNLTNGLPINIPTQSINTTYRQIGILTKGDIILPLMGKPLFTNRDKWNFYTMNDKNNMIKLPLSNKGKSCTNEFGCDNIYNGDTIYVEGYNDVFKATVYDNQVMQYIPYI